MSLKIAENNRLVPYFLAVMFIAGGSLSIPTYAASENLTKTLGNGTTTQVTPTKRTPGKHVIKKSTSTLTGAKTSTVQKKGPPKIISAQARGDSRNGWSKKWGPLVPHKNFPKKCDICHIPKRWDVLRPDFHFDHLKETKFALEGTHAKIACLLCHNDRAAPKGLVSRSCSACHQDPHKGTLGLDCQKCHSEVNWTPIETALGQHARTRFPLTGLHATVLCIQCHTRSQAGDYSGAPVDCFSCHQADYNKAPNHVSMNFAKTCRDCHTTTSFTGALFDHGTLGANPNCYQCHQADYEGAKSPPHVGVMPTTCQNCHVTSTWFLGAGGTTFDHASTGFPLTAAHASATCVECHGTSNYSIPNANCLPCHNTDFGTGSYVTASAPGATPVQHDPTNYPGSSCANCHGDFQSWSNGTAFNHAAIGFPLTGAHNTACANCHNLAGVTLSGNTLTATCATCHQSVNTGNGSYNTATNPMPHNSTLTPIASCKTCHGDLTSWTSGKFTDHSPTGFALTAAHATKATCADCHDVTPYTNNGGKISGTNCVPCHNADYATASAPGATPVRHDTTNYPTSSCASCHGDFAAWTNGTAFNHAGVGFPLTGAHNTACANCHIGAVGGPDFTGKGHACTMCHQSYDTGNGSYNTATNPMPHNSTLTPAASCQTCHGDLTSWTNGKFTNHAPTGFTLTAAHATKATCADCHDVTPYTNSGGHISGTNCVPCHNTDFGTGSYVTASAPGATPVQHDPTNYPASSCNNCHGDFSSWSNGSAFNHASVGFPLTGAHNTACANCHIAAVGGPDFTGKGHACTMCHQSYNTGNGSYNTATSPVPHTAANMPVAQCQTCHGDLTSWTNGTFPTHGTTGFTLTGKHLSATCATCHSAANGGYTIANANCVPCHATDYNSTSPSHSAMGWLNSTPACTQCHGDYNSWASGVTNAAPIHASFTGGFALIGAHLDSGKTNSGGVISSCDGCHANSNSYISGTSCIPCHQADYASASLPSATPVVHDSTNYPASSCVTCHGDYIAWTNGVGHTHLKPLTGMHNTACTNCHNAALGQNQTNWTCSNCHLSYDTGHGDYVNATTPIDHDMKNGGTYALPTACDNCHSYASAWTTTIAPHPTGNCGSGTGGTTPWNHENCTSCSDCHTTVTSMSVADGTFSCALCHRGQHKGTKPGTCAGG